MIEDAIDAPVHLNDEVDVYGYLVDLGTQAGQKMDEYRWKLGEYTSLLVRHYARYGDATVEHYAREIQVDAGRLYEFKSMVEFYPYDRRAEMSELNLTYTHFREAKRLGDLDQAMEFLKVAAENHMTCDDMREALKVMKRVQGLDIATTYTPPMTATGPRYNPVKYPAWDGTMNLSVDDNGRLILEDPDIPLPKLEKKRYRVIFEAIDE